MALHRWSAGLLATLFLVGFVAGGALAAKAVAGPASARVVLTLRYRSSGFVPVPRVPGTTRITLPLYPGSTPTTRRFPMGFHSPLPATPYLQVASATFLAVAPETVVEAWYRREMPRLGWISNSQGSSGDYFTGVSQSMIGFASPGWVTATNQEEITVWFYVPSPHTTLVGMWATRVVLPSRPKSTYLPSRILRITGHVYGSNSPEPQVSITNPAAISRLSTAINRLQVIMAGAFSCPDIHLTANLTFQPHRGRPVKVQIEAGCSVSVRGVGFRDAPSVQPELLWALAHPSP